MLVGADEFRSMLDAIGRHLDGVANRLAEVAEAPAGATLTVSELDAFIAARIETPNAELTADLCGLPEIPFRYIPDGCYARAHIMAKLLGDHGINNSKLFVVGDLSARNTDYPNGVQWCFHVAPLVVASDAGGNTLRIVDPALQPTSLTPWDWIRAVDPSNNVVELHSRSRIAYLPFGHDLSFEQNLPAARAMLKDDTDYLGHHHLFRMGRLPMPTTRTFRGRPWFLEIGRAALGLFEFATRFVLLSDFQIQVASDALSAGRMLELEAFVHNGEVLRMRAVEDP
jgi:hypothetical protein